MRHLHGASKLNFQEHRDKKGGSNQGDPKPARIAKVWNRTLQKEKIIIIKKITKRGQRLMSEEDFKMSTAIDIEAGRQIIENENWLCFGKTPVSPLHVQV